MSSYLFSPTAIHWPDVFAVDDEPCAVGALVVGSVESNSAVGTSGSDMGVFPSLTCWVGLRPAHVSDQVDESGAQAVGGAYVSTMVIASQSDVPTGGTMLISALTIL